MNKLIVLCGFSASGKDSLTDHLCEKFGYEKVISTSSRPIRVGESEGDPYYFVTREAFESMIENDELIECRKYNTLVGGIPDTWYYGIHKDNLDISKFSYVVVLDMLGLMEVKEQFGDKVTSFFIEVPEPVRRERAKQGRQDFDLTEWNRRYNDDKEQFPAEKIFSEVDYVVRNEDFDLCVNEIINKIKE